MQTAIALDLDPRDIQLLIDIKSESYQTQEVLVSLLDNYPAITSFEQTSFVISGNKPALEDYVNYPSHIILTIRVWIVWKTLLLNGEPAVDFMIDLQSDKFVPMAE